MCKLINTNVTVLFFFSIFIIFLAVNATSANADRIVKTYPDFSDLSDFTLTGSAVTYNTTPINSQSFLRLTDTTGEGGGVFITNTVDLTSDASFSAFFTFQIGGPVPEEWEDQGGDALYFNVQTAQGSVNVEFDTYNHGAIDENSGNHVGINIDGDSNNTVALMDEPTLFNDGNIKYVWIDYEGNTDVLEVRWSTTSSRPASALLSHTLDLPAILESTSVQFSFYAQTGAAWGEHDVLSFAFVNEYQPLQDLPPIAEDLTYSFQEDSSDNAIQLDATDPEANPVTYNIVSGPINGRIANFSTTTGALTYTPDWNFAGNDTIEYTADDGSGNGNTATVTITVNQVNDAPVVPNPIVYTANTLANNVSGINISDDSVISMVAGVWPNSVEVNKAGTLVYVGNDVSQNVSVIDTSTNTKITDIPTGEITRKSVLSPDESRLYVALQGNYSPAGVAVIDTHTNTFVTKITIGSGAFTQEVAISPDGTRVYAVNPLFNSVSVIDTDLLQVVDTISVGSTPYHLAITPDGSWLYVTNQDSDDVYVIDTSNNSVIGSPIQVGDGARGITINSDGTRAYVANYSDNSVSIIDISTNMEIDTITGIGLNGPLNLSLSLSNQVLYVINFGFPGNHQNFVSVVNLNSRSVIGNPIVTGEAVEDIAPKHLPGIYITDEEIPANVTLFANDVENDDLTYSIITPPENGTLSGDAPNLTYTPESNFSGTDSFVYQVSDSEFDSGTSIIKMIVNEGEDPNLYLSPISPTVYRGEEIELTAEIADTSDMLGYRLALNYDPNQIRYVPGSATFSDTSCAGWLGPIVNDASATGQLICTAASQNDPLASGSGTLLKFRMRIDDDIAIADGTTIEMTFDQSLTTVNDGGITVDTLDWSGDVFGPNNMPTFDGGPDQALPEDAGPQEISNWAANISPGPTYESFQDVFFLVETDNPSLFEVLPTISPTGTLDYKSASDANGTASITATLYDDGGTANGGNDASVPYNFIISVTPVNDAPDFIPGATVAFLNRDGSQQEVQAWATGLKAGPSNEADQQLTFMTDNDQPALFSTQPVIDTPTGTLTVTLASNAHGVINTAAAIYDDGGVLYGGANSSATKTFKIISFTPFLWGDLDDNAKVGAVDAYHILRYDAKLINSFPKYPPNEYPEYSYSYYTEYFPAPTDGDPIFTPAADVNWDQVIGGLDAFHVLRHFAMIITHFPADSDLDDWGPDMSQGGGKVAERPRADLYSPDRTLTASVNETDSSYTVIVSVDQAQGVSALKLALRYDSQALEIAEGGIQWLVNDPQSIVVSNNKDGQLVLSGALSIPLQGESVELMAIPFHKRSNQTTPVILVDSSLSRINDGQFSLSADSVKAIPLSQSTNICNWMLH